MREGGLLPRCGVAQGPAKGPRAPAGYEPGARAMAIDFRMFQYLILITILIFRILLIG